MAKEKKKKQQKRLERRAETGRWPHVAAATAACLALLCFCFWGGGQYPFGANTLATGETSGLVLPLAASVGESGIGYSLGFGLGMQTTAPLLQMLASPFTLLLFLPGVTLAQGANLLVLAKLTAAAFAGALLFTGRYSPFSTGVRLGAILGFWYAFGGFALVGAGGAVALLDILYLLPLGTMALGMLAQKGQVLPLALVLAAALVIAPRQCLVLLPLLGLFLAVWLLFFAGVARGGVLAARALCALAPALLLSAPSWLAIQGAGASAGGFAALFEGLLPFTSALGRLGALLCGGTVLASLALVVWGKLYRAPRVRFLLVCLGISVLPLVFTPIAAFWGWLSSAGQDALLYLPGFLSVLLFAAVLEALYHRPQRQEDNRASLTLVLVNLAVFLGLSAFVVLAHYGRAAVLAGEEITGLQFRYILFYALVCAVVLFGLGVLRGGIDLTRRAFSLALAVVVAGSAVYGGLVYLVPVLAGGGGNTLAAAGAASGLAGETDVGGRVKGATFTVAANLPGTAGYPSLGSAFGDAAMDTISVYKKLGYSGYGTELSGHGGTILSDALLNVEYALGYNGAWYLQPTPAANGWATVVQGGAALLADASALPGGDRYDAQDWLYQTVFRGEGNIMRRYEATHTEGVLYEEYPNQADRYGVWQATEGVQGVLEYTIYVGEREALYFDCFRFLSADLDEVVNDGLAVSVNGAPLADLYPTRTNNGILHLGTFENETVTVRIDLLRSELVRGFGVAGILESDVINAVANLPAVQADVGGGTLTFVADGGAGAATTGPLLVLPMAYSENARATVNGREATVHRVLDGLMAVELGEGENTVALRFTGAALPGALLCLAGLLLLAVLWFTRRGRVLANGSAVSDTGATLGRVCRLACILWGALAALVLFAAPLALWAANGLLLPGAE